MRLLHYIISQDDTVLLNNQLPTKNFDGTEVTGAEIIRYRSSDKIFQVILLPSMFYCDYIEDLDPSCS
jgi:hypothetical protein